MSPCYEPPRDAKSDAVASRYVATLHDIEDECDRVLSNVGNDPKLIGQQGLAQQIKDIIGAHWGKK